MMAKSAYEGHIPLAKAKSKKSFRLGHDLRTQLELKTMLWPAIILIVIFDFVPMYGLLMAFKAYDPFTGVKGIFTSQWNNFENFMFVFRNFEFWPMVKNTLGINLLGSLIGIPVTLMFALLLNEIRNPKFKSWIQTVTYLPHFLSWVIFGGLFITLLNPDGGIVNYMLLKLDLIDRPIQFLGDPDYFWGIAIGTSLLKEIGWGAILYLAAIAGIDQSLYEAAAIDGAGRFKRMMHITLPSILPTVMILIIFAVSGMLNNNFTQIYVLQNSLNLPASQVIDTYVYRTGIQQFQFAPATAIGLMKSIFALALLLGANILSKRLTKSGLF
ncbi:putative aldouronate transport system permease protein [Paenibacillus sp. V4I3]|uniref:ABC transporter permease n=1 Tax=unclassified Paenibacillus TaxID=185978 RepID=UPI0027834E0F|nr:MULTISPECIES: ABC transporter permease subunit [unclassified Paenibacillus]MDQ0874533.1 putative aldouronate transport system permease protein [Paenibacillus sp. V4I3]MDQ0889706.1 putative aldouronate transport system permease protein [Paenibacillus sp. V4I9]